MECNAEACSTSLLRLEILSEKSVFGASGNSSVSYMMESKTQIGSPGHTYSGPLPNRPPGVTLRAYTQSEGYYRPLTLRPPAFSFQTLVRRRGKNRPGDRTG